LYALEIIFIFRYR